MLKFGYEDTDKKIEIEIYGLRFEIKNLTNDNVEELRNINKDLNSLENEIEKILGNGAVKKINEKRVADGYSVMTIDIELAILGCIFESYANASTDNVINKVKDTAKGINDKIDNITKTYQGNYNRNYRRNNYRRNYRRY